jgi:hypothetical protein
VIVAAIVVIALLLLVIFCLFAIGARLAEVRDRLENQTVVLDATYDRQVAASEHLQALVEGQVTAGKHLQALAEHFATPPVATGHPVTVHTKKPDDQSIHGLLLHEYPTRLELVDAHFVSDPERKVIPGVVRIATSNISFRQDHPVATDAADS